MELILHRTYYPGGTNGDLRIKDHSNIICRTIELPWKENKARISCIPEGKYAVKMRFSLKFKQHMILQEVNGRSLILIHPANNAVKELHGCIAPVTTLTGEGKGSASRKAFTKLIALVIAALEKEPVFLTIKSKDHDD